MMTPIATNLGSMPAINTRTNNPRLLNMYVAKDNNNYCLPSLDLLASIENILAVHETSYNGGSYIVATQNSLLRVDAVGSINHLAPINTVNETVRIDENQQNEVIIVTGANAYVYQQKINLITTLGSSEGFDLVNPVDVCVLATITVIIGGTDKKWVASTANNALVYNDSDIFITDESMGNLTGCATMNNNLFVFGTGGIQRWLPSIERTVYDFPFREDTNFRGEFGAISTGSIVDETDEIYYLANNFTIRVLSPQGDNSISPDGMPLIFSEFLNPEFSRSSMLYYEGQYFYQITFPDSEESWVYNEDSGKWSESTDLVIDATSGVEFNQTAVVTAAGLNLLTSVQTSKERVLQSAINEIPTSTDNQRMVCSSVRLDMVQGLSQTNTQKVIELAVSKDNLRFGNYVTRDIGRVGNTQQTMTWRMNISARQFSFKIRYYGDFNVIFKRMVANIN